MDERNVEISLDYGNIARKFMKINNDMDFAELSELLTATKVAIKAKGIVNMDEVNDHTDNVADEIYLELLDWSQHNEEEK